MFKPIGPQSQYGAAMSPSQSQNDGSAIPLTDDHDGYGREPQQPRAPSHHQAVPFASMSTGLVWEQHVGSTLSGSPAHVISKYDALGEHGLYHHPNTVHASATAPYDYTVQQAYTPTYTPAYTPAYTPPAMPHPVLQPQTPFGMHAGTDAGQASHPQMPLHCQSEIDPSLPQVHPNVFSPNQSMSGMTATGFEPNNNMNHFIGSPMPSPSGQNPASFAQNGHATNPHPEEVPPQPNDIEPPANPNGWTEEQDDLVRRLKHKRKKVAQIKEELKKKFGVERSENAISKRWKIIKKRDSRAESKTVLQNVMTPFVRLFNAALARVAPRNHHDPQVSGIMLNEQHEVREHFEKGLTKLVEECVLMLQRGPRHGGANL